MDKVNRHVDVGGIFAMLVFWVLVWLSGSRWLTTVYLGLTMLTILLVAKANDVKFADIALDTKWVFPSIVGMAVLSMIAANYNLLRPEPVGHDLLDWIKSLVGLPKKKLHDSVFWSVVNRLFFGKAFTNEWRKVALIYVLWIIPGFFISFWKQIKNRKKEIAAVAGTLLVANAISKRNKKLT